MLFWAVLIRIAKLNIVANILAFECAVLRSSHSYAHQIKLMRKESELDCVQSLTAYSNLDPF